MAWTSSDLTIVETAIREAMTAGVVSVSIAGQQVQVYTLKELRDLRAEILAEVAGSNSWGSGGIRTRQIVPGGCG